MALRILLVEDNPAEAHLTREALAESGVAHHLHIVGDGEEATTYLQQGNEDRDWVNPDMILLDLNLPKKDGRQVLRELKADPLLRMIPVIVVTNSQSPDDIQQVYLLNANCYLVKPQELDAFFGMIKKIVDFWWGTAQLPSCPASPRES